MARPNLTSLFSKFLFRETLTSEEKGYIRSDISAETSGAAATAQALAISTAAADATAKADAKVDNAAYNADTWDGVTSVAPSKNAVRDKIESMAALTFAGTNPNGVVGVAASASFTVTGPISVGGDSVTIDGDLYAPYTGTAPYAPRDVLYAGASTTDAATAFEQTIVLANGVTVAAAARAYTASVVGSTVTVSAKEAGVAGNGITLSANGDISVTGNLSGGVDPIPALSATHLGQWCKASTAWWQWSGESGTWMPVRLLTGEPITRNASGSWFSISVDADGALAQTPFNP